MHDSGESSSSSVKVFGNIFISFIGAGVLGLPYAFKEAGILEGVVIMSFVGYLSVTAMLLLIDCKDHILKNKFQQNSNISYKKLQQEDTENLINNRQIEIKPSTPTIDEDNIGYGDVGFYAYGKFGALLVDVAIVVSQTGFCCAYLIFISENMAQYITNGEKYTNFLIYLMVVPLTLLCLLRKLNKLAVFSLVADFANISAYLIVFWFDFEHAHTVRNEIKQKNIKSHSHIHPKEMDLSGFPFFAGMAVYCYEGAGMILSLEGSMERSVRHKFRGVFKLAMLLITTLYIVFGVCGYMSFGPETDQIITLNLPPGLFPALVKMFLCFSLFFTYPVMMFPVIQIIQKRSKKCRDSHYVGNIVRGMMVILTGLVVMVIPSFSTLMVLIGACICSPLAFILPALFHLKIFNKNLSKSKRFMDYLIILVGIFAYIIGSMDAVKRLTSGEPEIPPDQNSMYMINDTLK